MTRRRGTAVAAVVGLLLLVVLVWLVRPSGDGTPLDPRGTGPTGTAALVRLVGQLGGEVSIESSVPRDAAPRTIVVLADRFDPATRAEIDTAVRAGARLVLFDPASPMSPVPVRGQLVTDLFGVVGHDPACPLLDDLVGRVESARWSVLDPGPRSTAACFPVADGHGLVVQDVGEGELAVTGAVDALVNQSIGEADHARLAAALLVPDGGGRVTFVWDASIGGDTALLDLVPTGVRRALWVLAAAVVLYVLARGRRLGPPIDERLPVRVPASELALAIGDLLGRHGHRDAAAARLRHDVRVEVAEALHVPADTPPDVLVELLAQRAGGGVDRDGLRTALLDGPVPDDRALVGVGAVLARVRQRLREGSGAGGPPRPPQ